MLDLFLYRIAPPIVTAAAGFVTGRYVFPSRPSKAEMRELLGLPAEKKAVKATPVAEAAAPVTAAPEAVPADGNFKDFRELLSEIQDIAETADTRFTELRQEIVTSAAAAAAAATKAVIDAAQAAPAPAPAPAPAATTPKKTTTPKPAAKATKAA